MNRVEILNQTYKENLRRISHKYNVDYNAIETLLDAERTQKLLKRKTLIQEIINTEIENTIDK